jgi:hypothetical protein
LLRRVEEVNGVAEYLFRIPTVIVYGSYVRGEILLSDVDIAVELEAKWDPATISHEEFVARTNKRVQAASTKGRTFSSFFEQLEWPRREVLLHLKARTRGLSLQPLNDFVQMEKDDNFAYRVLIGNANKIAEQLAKRAAQLNRGSARSQIFPAVVITGPRRSGKTTLLRQLFPKAQYVLLEDPDIQRRIRSDPRTFLEELRTPVLLDEIQNAPEPKL